MGPGARLDAVARENPCTCRESIHFPEDGHNAYRKVVTEFRVDVAVRVQP